MSRKDDHLDLTSKVQQTSWDSSYSTDFTKLFNYEPLFGKHPTGNFDDIKRTKTFVGKQMNLPFWLSSMTGGAEKAKLINTNMAKVCSKLGLGMGLGSVRPLLNSKDSLADYDLRTVLGDDRPFYANLGIAQVEELLTQNKHQKILDIIKLLEADGLIIHINPLQEWFQPEGDSFKRNPFETLRELLEKLDIQVIVKEVGHGFGPKSLAALFELPIKAIELSGMGGTNFSRLETMRHDESEEFSSLSSGLINMGHCAIDMVHECNKLMNAKTTSYPDLIVSGGVNDVLHAKYLNDLAKGNIVIGQAFKVLEKALISSEVLEEYICDFFISWEMADSFLELKK
jgi:isopentenyl-diphosphate delta-isomerase